MWRLLLFLIGVTAAALSVAYLADRPGDVSVQWLGTIIETNIYVALLALGLALIALALLWGLIRYFLGRPRAVRQYLATRNEERGREAITRGMIAAELGDADVVGRSASAARKALPADPLTALLRVKAARLAGDSETARAVLEDMTLKSETELVGLHGLYLEAKRESELEAARQFAERALESNPRLAWSSAAVLDLQARAGDWQGALETLSKAERAGHHAYAEVQRKRAVLLTAQALEKQLGEPEGARELALEAHKLAPGLVPAASLAARLVAAQGSERQAGKIIAKTWALSPHPDLATAYAYLRMGDSPRERLARVRELADSSRETLEGAIAIASAALDAREWQDARAVLAPLLEDRPTARVFSLMARAEEGESSDTGRVREWLARALRAPRDPAWMSDSVVFKDWAPISPMSGALDTFTWMAPVEALEGSETPIIEAAGSSGEEIQTASEPARLAQQSDGQDGKGANDNQGEAAEVLISEPERSSTTLARAPDDPGERGTYVEEEGASEKPVPGPPPESSS